MEQTGTATLLRARRDRGLTLRQAAREMGIGHQTLQRAERRLTVPHPSTMKKIAGYYGLRPTSIWPVTVNEGPQC